MLDKGTEGMMVFEPALVKVEPGDTVKFVGTNKGHNAESIKGMLPGGGAPFLGKVNQDITVTFDKPGVYGVKCLPHYGMGMVALIVVGTPANADQAKAVTHPGKAKQVFANLFGKLPAITAISKVTAMAPIPRLKPYQGPALFSYGFRPFFLFGPSMRVSRCCSGSRSSAASSRSMTRSRRATGTCTRCSTAMCRR